MRHELPDKGAHTVSTFGSRACDRSRGFTSRVMPTRIYLSFHGSAPLRKSATRSTYLTPTTAGK